MSKFPNGNSETCILYTIDNSIVNYHLMCIALFSTGLADERGNV